MSRSILARLMAVYRFWEMGRLKIQMESQRIRVMSTLWPLTVCSVDHCLRRTMALRAGGQATLYHPQQHRSIPLSKFCGLYVFEDASSMQACAVETTVEIKIMAGGELLCRIPKMTDGIGDGVSLRKGHYTTETPAPATLSRTTQRRSRGASARAIE